MPAAYALARERYAEHGVDAESAIDRLARVSLSFHCWQGDDVGGLEGLGASLGAGLAVTGRAPGKARNGDELRSDLGQALALVPGRHRANLHASYAEPECPIPRDQIAPEDFARWLDWAKDLKIGLDFNSTFFAHPLAEDGLTLSCPEPLVRSFWVEHGRAARRIASHFGRELGSPCVHNVWVPDGSKEPPADRKGPRERLAESLDDVFEPKLPHVLDAVEPKLFGIGSESYVVGSYDFYLGYAITRKVLLCLDMGHYHPTESVADKLSSVLLYLDRVLLHLSRGVRWDSDHVVIVNDELTAVAQELVRGGFLDRVHLGLDYFDASVNRVAAWTVGARSALKALLVAMLDPIDELRRAEEDDDFTTRLVLTEEAKTWPFGAVWDEHCRRQGVPEGGRWLETVRAYERDVLSKRTGP